MRSYSRIESLINFQARSPVIPSPDWHSFLCHAVQVLHREEVSESSVLGPDYDQDHGGVKGSVN